MRRDSGLSIATCSITWRPACSARSPWFVRWKEARSMSLRNPHPPKSIAFVLLLMLAGTAWAQEEPDPPTTEDRPMHGESAAQHDESEPPEPEIEPAIPPEMTLEEVFEYAESPPPADFPHTVPDDRTYVFTMFDQLEYRVATDDGDADHLGWEAQGWIGGDFNKFWWKNEGEAAFDGPNEGESETDLLYSRLVTPFWNFQAGLQYANEWHEGDYEDRWSGVIAMQGLAPTSSNSTTRFTSPRTVMQRWRSKPNTTSALPSAWCFSRGPKWASLFRTSENAAWVRA